MIQMKFVPLGVLNAVLAFITGVERKISAILILDISYVLFNPLY